MCCHTVRPKIRAFVPRRKNCMTQGTSPADATHKRVYCLLRKPGDSDLLGGRAPQTANWASFYRQKNHIISMLHTGYKVIGYTFTKQFYWYNFAGFCSNLKQFYWYKWCGLLFKLRRPWAFQLSHGLLLGAY